MDANGLTLSDIAAVTNDNAFGGGNIMTILLLFILIFGMGGLGYNRGMGDYGQYATAASQQEILFGQQLQGLDNKIDRIGNGIADLGYANQGLINNAQTVLGGAIATEGRTTQGQIADFKYDNAMQNADIKTAIHAEGEATRNMLQQDKIATLTAQVNELKTQNMFCGIPRINPYGYGVYAYNGCGCGMNAL